MADPVVTITNGVPTGGTGIITTLGQTLVDGANATMGVTTGAAVTTNAAGTLQQYLRGIVSLLVSGITVATHAVTQSGSWVLSAGSAVIGKVGINDGTSNLTLMAASSGPPAATVVAVPVSIRDTNANQEVAGTSGTASHQGAPVVGLDIYSQYKTAAASATTVMGATGAQYDYLAGVIIIPGTAGCGTVGMTDGNGSTISLFAGGGTTALPDLRPFFVPLGLYALATSTPGWRLILGANVTAIGVGKFT